MENKPTYRFKYRIEDTNLGELVISGSTYVSEIDEDGSCESIEVQLFSDLRAFANKIRPAYESNQYPQHED